VECECALSAGIRRFRTGIGTIQGLWSLVLNGSLSLVSCESYTCCFPSDRNESRRQSTNCFITWFLVPHVRVHFWRLGSRGLCWETTFPIDSNAAASDVYYRYLAVDLEGTYLVENEPNRMQRFPDRSDGRMINGVMEVSRDRHSGLSVRQHRTSRRAFLKQFLC